MRKAALVLDGAGTGHHVARKLVNLGYPVTLIPYSQLIGFYGKVGNFVAHIGSESPRQLIVQIRAGAIILTVENERPAGLDSIAALLNIALNDHGMVAANQFWPVLTNREGIFVVDGGKRSADTAETLALADKAAAMAACVLAAEADQDAI